MAVVETPDRIMSTTSGWGEGGMGMNGMWILLLAFLFIFRGRDGFGDGGHGGHFAGAIPDQFRRSDAEFAQLNRNEWDLQKEGIIGRYENRIQNLECCCKEVEAINKTDCDVINQGEKTRATIKEVHEWDIIERQREKICALEARLNKQETVTEVIAGVHRMLDDRFKHFEEGRFFKHHGECC